MSERESAFAQNARQVLNDGEPREAIQILAPWLQLDPDDAGAWEVIRAAHLELGELGEAEHAAREVVRLRPENVEASHELENVLRRAEKADPAREVAHAAPRIEQKHVDLRQVATELPPQAPAEPPAPPAPPASPVRAPRKRAREKPSADAEALTNEKPPWGWHEEPDRSSDGWKVRSPDGRVSGPYTEAQLGAYLLSGSIGADWGARFGSGRILTVREALGAQRTAELLRERAGNVAVPRVIEPPPEPPDVLQAVEVGGLRCPHCGGVNVISQKKSANSARIVVVILGFLFLPAWLLLLVLKDRMEYTCTSCGMHWTGEV